MIEILTPRRCEMFYDDKLYGRIELPDFIESLLDTPVMQRLHNISQDVLPQGFLPWEVPSRFEHSVGVLYLAMQTLEHNNFPKSIEKILMISALLHDTGNPCLSHLGEPFLIELTGMDGESFLKEMLNEQSIQWKLKELGIPGSFITKVVTGNYEPLSTILNGSIDIDNIDNVARYWQSAHPKDSKRYDAIKIASSFRFDDQWYLPQEHMRDVLNWQKLRQDVYNIVYGNPKLNAVMMVYRALSIAFNEGLIDKSFFLLNDEQAIDFLKERDEDSGRLIEDVLKHQWYEEIFSIETESPSENLKKLAQQWDARTLLANVIAEQCDIAPSDICCYVGVGRDKRRIEIPFADKKGIKWCVYDQQNAPIYRVKIYLAPMPDSKIEKIKKAMNKFI